MSLVSLLQVIVDVVRGGGRHSLKALVIFASQVAANVRRWSFSLTSVDAVNTVVAYIKILNVVIVVLQPFVPLVLLALVKFELQLGFGVVWLQAVVIWYILVLDHARQGVLPGHWINRGDVDRALVLRLSLVFLGG